MCPQEFLHGNPKKKRKVITDEAVKRQENLKAKTALLETEFSKLETEKFSENNSLKQPNEHQVQPKKLHKTSFLPYFIYSLRGSLMK